MMKNSTHEFERLLGKATLALWSSFPRKVQESLFETAVAGDAWKTFGVVSARPSSKNGSPSKADAVGLTFSYPFRLLISGASPTKCAALERASIRS
jgi:hypothetical protein